ncbi:MAG TPA: hypothetical protein VHM93_10335 [Candidatus Acidoferrum sp.]|jgi:hypothetical protein|nr:hypothetical protein [Candidatus Acidoferrum sp.]
MKTLRGRIKRADILLALIIAAVAAPAGKAQVRPGDFDVTDGKIESAPGKRLKVSTKEMRARLKFSTEQSVTVKFTYLGPTKQVAPVASKEVRSQFGVKLRAHDDCNAVYIMWHFAPDQKIAVSVKRNPGKRTHAECLDRGYINNIKPRIADVPERVEVNQPHVLVASMSGSDLTVTADNKLVWWGDLGPVALSFSGPVGLSSDNARVVFDLLVSR